MHYCNHDPYDTSAHILNKKKKIILEINPKVRFVEYEIEVSEFLLTVVNHGPGLAFARLKQEHFYTKIPCPAKVTMLDNYFNLNRLRAPQRSNKTKISLTSAAPTTATLFLLLPY